MAVAAPALAPSLGALGSTMAAGGLSSVANYAVYNTYMGEKVTLNGMVSNFVTGAVIAGLFYGADKLIGKGVNYLKNTVNPKKVNFMQSSIKNQTGNHTVIGNAEALKNGTLSANDLPKMRVWKDASNKIWTLDNRRLAAFKLADIKRVPVQWATTKQVSNEMWKMTTKTGGESIILKLMDGLRTIVR